MSELREKSVEARKAMTGGTHMEGCQSIPQIAAKFRNDFVC